MNSSILWGMVTTICRSSGMAHSKRGGDQWCNRHRFSARLAGWLGLAKKSAARGRGAAQEGSFRRDDGSIERKGRQTRWRGDPSR
jgi:hypothetical protein